MNALQPVRNVWDDFVPTIFGSIGLPYPYGDLAVEVQLYRKLKVNCKIKVMRTPKKSKVYI